MLLPQSTKHGGFEDPRPKKACTGTFVNLVTAFAFALVCLYTFLPSWIREQVSRWPSRLTSPPPPTAATKDLHPLRLPPEYEFVTAQDAGCTNRFCLAYLEDLRDHAVGYCSQDSRSNVTCFHSKQSNGQVDSLCFGRGAVFDTTSGRFALDCSLRDLAPAERASGVVPFQEIGGYWSETGPPSVFAQAVDINTQSAHVASTVEEDRESWERVGTKEAAAAEPVGPPRNYLLVKREDGETPENCLMEIFSAWMTTDVLRMSRDPSHDDEPFFRGPEDLSDTQVVILDSHADGPYFDLWTLFAQRKPVRLGELASSPAAIEGIQDANIIVPLAGGSNPLWQQHWQSQPPRFAATLSVFVRRVLGFYHLGNPMIRMPDQPMVVTVVNRKSSGILENVESLLEELERRHPHIVVRVMDVDAVSFAEQLRIVRDTDVLVGVHGAGLSHAMFMREGAGAVVEIQPQGPHHQQARDVSAMRDLAYFRAHAVPAPENQRVGRRAPAPDSVRGDGVRRSKWHWDDVWVNPDGFVDVIDSAIKLMYSKGPWDLDLDVD